MPRSVRASVRPSVKRHAVEPGGSGRVVWRSPVRSPIPSGGEPPGSTGSYAVGPTTSGAG
jgi:hypothetical protein